MKDSGLRVSLPAGLPVCLHACLPTCLFALPACLPACLIMRTFSTIHCIFIFDMEQPTQLTLRFHNLYFLQYFPHLHFCLLTSLLKALIFMKLASPYTSDTSGALRVLLKAEALIDTCFCFRDITLIPAIRICNYRGYAPWLQYYRGYIPWLLWL